MGRMLKAITETSSCHVHSIAFESGTSVFERQKRQIFHVESLFQIWKLLSDGLTVRYLTRKPAKTIFFFFQTMSGRIQPCPVSPAWSGETPFLQGADKGLSSQMTPLLQLLYLLQRFWDVTKLLNKQEIKEEVKNGGESSGRKGEKDWKKQNFLRQVI
jgi:hypothetical protein